LYSNKKEESKLGINISQAKKTEPRHKENAKLNKIKRDARSKRLATQNLALQKRPACRPREWTDEDIELETEALIRWISNPNNYYFTSFLIERDLDTAHLDRFAKYSETFRLTLEKAKRVQEQRLVDLAVTKKGDGGFIKFILQNKAGWKDKQEISGDAANPLAVIMGRIADSANDPLDYDG